MRANPIYTDLVINDGTDDIFIRSFDIDEHVWPFPGIGGTIHVEEKPYQVQDIEYEYFMNDKFEGCIITLHVWPLFQRKV